MMTHNLLRQLMIMALVMSYLWCGDIVPLPCGPTVRTAWLTEHSSQGGGGQLLGHLPHQTLRVVGEQHQVLLSVDVERG